MNIKGTHNKLKKTFINKRLETFEKPIKMLYEVFDVSAPQQAVEPTSTISRKRKRTEDI